MARERRRPSPALAALAAGCLVLVLVMARFLAAACWPRPLCPLREWTGWPCPMCGGVRALAALATGRLATALALNPLATLAALGLFAWSLAALLRLPAWGLAAAAGRLARPSVLAAALLLQWSYLIWRAFAAP